MKTKIESFINLLHGIKWLQVFTIYLRYLIGISFVYAFIWKLGDHLLLYQTKDLGKEVQLNPAFVFQSIMRIKSLWIAAAYAQLISGILLATQRFATLGAIIFFPVILCIFLITAYVGFNGTWEITFLMMLGTVYLLIWDIKKLLPIFFNEPDIVMDYSDTPQPFIHHWWWQLLGGILIVITFLNLLYANTFIWLLLCLITGLAGLLVHPRIIPKTDRK